MSRRRSHRLARAVVIATALLPATAASSLLAMAESTPVPPTQPSPTTSTSPTTPPTPAPTGPTASTAPSAPIVPGAAALPAGLVQLTDETGTITIAVPAAWQQVAAAPYTSGGTSTPTIVAAPDLMQFQETMDGSGVQYFTTSFAETEHGRSVASFADILLGDKGCADPVVAPYQDAVYTGARATLTGCTSGASEYHLLSVSAVDGSRNALIGVGIAPPDTPAMVDQILSTLSLPPGAPTASNMTLPTTPPTTTLPAFASPSGATPVGWTTVTDPSNTIQVAVPPSWAQVDDEPFGDTANLVIAPDLAAYNDLAGPLGPGINVGEWLYSDITTTGLGFYADECTDGGAQPFSTATLTGHLHVYTACSFNAAATVYFVAANTAGNTNRTLISSIVLTGSPDDAATLDGLLSSLRLLA